jgi:hypothetical protein
MQAGQLTSKANDGSTKTLAAVIPQATTVQKGLVQFATAAEGRRGVVSNKALTPAGQNVMVDTLSGSIITLGGNGDWGFGEVTLGDGIVSDGNNNDCVLIGYGAVARNGGINGSVVIGSQAEADSYSAVTIGGRSFASTRGTAIGYAASAGIDKTVVGFDVAAADLSPYKVRFKSKGGAEFWIDTSNRLNIQSLRMNTAPAVIGGGSISRYVTLHVNGTPYAALISLV